MEKALSFKIDVDTYEGMHSGVPKLLELLGRFQVKATFFLSFGPDNAGKAIWNIFRQKGFFKKMLRTKAAKLYGWRTVLSGTLLPARLIAAALPNLVCQIRDAGHEVGVHAWDHRFWQDHLTTLSEDAIAAQFAKSCDAFTRILNTKPKAVAAPGWQLTQKSLKVEDRLELLYASDLRNGEPCYPSLEGYQAQTLQIPTTTRCLEELIATGMTAEPEWEQAFIEDLSRDVHPVFPLHAEVEGGLFQPFFQKFLPKLLDRFPVVRTLSEYAEETLAAPTRPPVREIKFINLPGRGGYVASVEQ